MNAHSPAPVTAAAHPLFDLTNKQIDILHKLKALVETITDKLSNLEYPPDAPNTPELQTISTLAYLALDVIDHAAAGADEIFKAGNGARSS